MMQSSIQLKHLSKGRLVLLAITGNKLFGKDFRDKISDTLKAQK